MEIIDNSALTPRYLPDDQVNMEGWHPDWVKSLILAQLRVESATEEGTFRRPSGCSITIKKWASTPSG